MKNPFPTACRMLILPALCCGLWAEDATSWVPRPEVKLRVGYAPSPKDNLRSNALSYGINFVMPLEIGDLGLELGYHYKTGDLYAGAFQPVAAGKEALDTTQSVERKRNDLKGIYGRLSLRRLIPDSDFSYQGGLMIGGTQFRQEFVGDVRSQNWVAGNANAWRDVFTGTPTKGGLTVSPFAGISWRANKASSLELNLLFLNYKAIDYIHTPGGAATYDMNLVDVTGQPVGPLARHNDFPSDRLATHTRFVPHVEVGWTFHF
jgi:hypothetical protein